MGRLAKVSLITAPNSVAGFSATTGQTTTVYQYFFSYDLFLIHWTAALSGTRKDTTTCS